MADSDTPWEPPLAGSEIDHLVGALERLRTAFLWKVGEPWQSLHDGTEDWEFTSSRSTTKTTTTPACAGCCAT